MASATGSGTHARRRTISRRGATPSAIPAPPAPAATRVGAHESRAASVGRGAACGRPSPPPPARAGPPPRHHVRAHERTRDGPRLAFVVPRHRQQPFALLAAPEALAVLAEVVGPRLARRPLAQHFRRRAVQV